MPDLPTLVEQLSSLTVMEAAELSRMLEEKWGVSAAAPIQMAIAPENTVAPIPEKQTEFTVTLTGSGEKRVAVIKEVRSITGLGLKEAKDFTESAPRVLKESVSQEEADRVAKLIQDAGGTVTIH